VVAGDGEVVEVVDVEPFDGAHDGGAGVAAHAAAGAAQEVHVGDVDGAVLAVAGLDVLGAGAAQRVVVDLEAPLDEAAAEEPVDGGVDADDGVARGLDELLDGAVDDVGAAQRAGALEERERAGAQALGVPERVEGVEEGGLGPGEVVGQVARGGG
jgi:hypothetical protein